MRIENYRRTRPNWFAILVAIYLLICAAMIAGTIFTSRHGAASSTGRWRRCGRRWTALSRDGRS